MARRGCWTLKLEGLGMDVRADEKDTRAGGVKSEKAQRGDENGTSER